MIEGEVNAIAGEVKHMETEISKVEKKIPSLLLTFIMHLDL